MSDANLVAPALRGPESADVGERRLLTAAVLAALLGSFPVWLTGALAVQIRDDLDFGPARLGLASGSFFCAAALSSSLMGRVAERVGAARSLRVAVLASGTWLLVLAQAPTSMVLMVALACAGCTNSLSQVAANLLIARGVVGRRQGWALAVKQAGVPMGTLLGGLAVPAFGVTVGWRWAYVAAATLAVVAVVVVPTIGEVRVVRGAKPARRDTPLGPLLIVTVSIAFATAANGTLATFIVSAGVDAGLGESAAGLVLTGGSAVGITTRLIAGRRADRRSNGHLHLVSALLAVGAVGYLFLFVGDVPTHLIGAFVAFGFGWAWPGLFNLAIVRLNPSAPAAATGITQTGVYVGALSGPILLGLVIDQHGYRPAWAIAAVLALIGAAGVFHGRNQIVAARERSEQVRVTPSASESLEDRSPPASR